MRANKHMAINLEKTPTQPQTEVNAIKLLHDWALQRPGLCFADYGDVRTYKRESLEITKDLHDFKELLNLAWQLIPREKFNNDLASYLSVTDGRLTLKDNKLHYVVGQYFPTEYRPAASRVLMVILWNHCRDYIFNGDCTGIQIREFFRSKLNRRTFNNYFA